MVNVTIYGSTMDPSWVIALPFQSPTKETHHLPHQDIAAHRDVGI